MVVACGRGALCRARQGRVWPCTALSMTWEGDLARMCGIFGYVGRPNVLYGPYLTGAARALVQRIGR